MPALVVHVRSDVAHARHAAALLTSPDAACFLGIGYMLQMQTDAAPLPLLVGCGHDAALAHEALRVGIKQVFADVSPTMAAKLHAIAAQMGAHFTADYPADAIDIGNPTSLQPLHSD